MYYTSVYPSPVGLLTLASSGASLAGLWIEGQKRFKDTITDEMIENDALPIFDATRTWLDQYFAGQRPVISALPLAPAGSEFRQAVWRMLCDIPYGEVTTYGAIANEMAARMGKEKMSAQAVGGAVGHNPISIIIPCHRVVGSSGSLTGYSGGLAAKIKLLTWEGADMTRLFTPRKDLAL